MAMPSRLRACGSEEREQERLGRAMRVFGATELVEDRDELDMAGVVCLVLLSLLRLLLSLWDGRRSTCCTTTSEGVGRRRMGRMAGTIYPRRSRLVLSDRRCTDARLSPRPGLFRDILENNYNSFVIFI